MTEAVSRVRAPGIGHTTTWRRVHRSVVQPEKHLAIIGTSLESVDLAKDVGLLMMVVAVVAVVVSNLVGIGLALEFVTVQPQTHAITPTILKIRALPMKAGSA